MREITEKLHNNALESFRPVIESMAAEGCTQDQIVNAYKSQLRVKVNHFYEKQQAPQSLAECFNFADLQKKDSKIEAIFYGLLQGSGIKFTFQHNIGPYRVDYLVRGFLIIEIDGPQHIQARDDMRDKYLRKMGYKIIRIPTWVLVSCPDAAIQEIKDASRTRGMN